jgi:hypothetical protein
VTTRGQGRRRRVAGLLGAVAVTVALAGCTGGSDTRSAMQSTEAGPAPSGSPGASATAAGRETPTRGVTCDVHTCTVTLRTTDPRELEAFGATLRLDGIQDGAASLTVGDARVQCSQNQGVRAGARTLFCDEVTADSVTLTAEVG